MSTFKDVFTEDFLELQKREGKVITQTEIANRLDIGETSLSLAWNGIRPPSKSMVTKCADYFKDPRFYDTKNMPLPEALKDYTQRNWGGVPEDVKWKIVQQISEYTTEPLPNGDGDDHKPPDR